MRCESFRMIFSIRSLVIPVLLVAQLLQPFFALSHFLVAAASEQSIPNVKSTSDMSTTFLFTSESVNEGHPGTFGVNHMQQSATRHSRFLDLPETKRYLQNAKYSQLLMGT